jgi:hypothetical protein
MATRTLVTVLSDLSGESDASTVRFAIQDSAYEIDLTKAEATELFRVLDPYVKKARKVSGRAGAGVSSNSTRVGVYTRVKDWGRANGFSVNDRGRPSKVLVDAYQSATGEKV